MTSKKPKKSKKQKPTNKKEDEAKQAEGELSDDDLEAASGGTSLTLTTTSPTVSPSVVMMERADVDEMPGTTTKKY